MKIAFIGCGNVGLPLADRLQRAGHEVRLAAREAVVAVVFLATLG